MLLAIDSGKNTGWALFTKEGQLHSCGLKNVPGQAPGGQSITRVIIERPHTGRGRARARDIITLAIRAGEVGGVLRLQLGVEPEYIEPGRWKGQLKKKRTKEIAKEKLSPAELKIIGGGAKHDVWDAVGIGLYSVGRWII